MQSTPVFSLHRGVHSSIILKRIIGRYVWLLALPVALFIILGNLISATWYYLVPITIFLIAPMLLFAAYFIAVLNVEGSLAIVPHSFELKPEGLIYSRFEVREKEKEEGREKKSVRQGERKRKKGEPKADFRIYTADDYEFVKKGEELIPVEDIGERENAGMYEIINLKGGWGRFVVIPLQCKIIGDDKIGASDED